eukprot:1675614-Prymnesium_polylepis.1
MRTPARRLSRSLVWSIKPLAEKFGTTVNGKCWEKLLSRRQGENVMRDCPCPHLAGHKSMTDAAHVLSGF